MSTDKPLADLLRELDELHEKATRTRDDRDLYIAALTGAWPRLRDALDDAREVCEDACNERDALKAETEALREVAAAAERLNASRGCDCCAGDDYYPSVTALDAALAKWKEMGRG